MQCHARVCGRGSGADAGIDLLIYLGNLFSNLNGLTQKFKVVAINILKLYCLE